ncbi:MAG: c(7)-type cytochrome triheme domain-containing protein [Thermodesulfovibrionales bacterium]
MKLHILTLFIALIFSLNSTVFADGGDILYTKPVKSVLFSHKSHAKISCDRCHSGLFEMKALAAQEKPDFNMDALYKGKYCGACHNGKDAFASNTQCARCHGGVSEYEHFKKKPQKKVDIKGPQDPIMIGVGDTSVSFKHNTHAKIPCSDCHSKLFRMKKGTTKVTFKEHHQNTACFYCHDGKQSFGMDNCIACHGKKPFPKRELVYTLKGGVPPAYFGHDLHTKMFKCEDCHNKHFPMKMRGSGMNMQKMYEGKYCGACHNGRLSFDVKVDCVKCHYYKK